MKIEKFKVLLYLKKSGMGKNGKAPIMGRITVNRTMAQFSCKLSCTPSLWNPRASRLEGKSKEAVETICKMLGHQDVKMTQRYARVTQKKLFEDMDKFIAATEKDFILAL